MARMHHMTLLVTSLSYVLYFMQVLCSSVVASSSQQGDLVLNNYQRYLQQLCC
jgi:hypothetical protein